MLQNWCLVPVPVAQSEAAGTTRRCTTRRAVNSCGGTPRRTRAVVDAHSCATSAGTDQCQWLTCFVLTVCTRWHVQCNCRRVLIDCVHRSSISLEPRIHTIVILPTRRMTAAVPVTPMAKEAHRHSKSRVKRHACAQRGRNQVTHRRLLQLLPLLAYSARAFGGARPVNSFFPRSPISSQFHSACLSLPLVFGCSNVAC